MPHCPPPSPDAASVVAVLAAVMYYVLGFDKSGFEGLVSGISVNGTMRFHVSMPGGHQVTDLRKGRLGLYWFER